jgi:hypothetical protein
MTCIELRQDRRQNRSWLGRIEATRQPIPVAPSSWSDKRAGPTKILVFVAPVGSVSPTTNGEPKNARAAGFGGVRQGAPGAILTWVNAGRMCSF